MMADNDFINFQSITDEIEENERFSHVFEFAEQLKDWSEDDVESLLRCLLVSLDVPIVTLVDGEHQTLRYHKSVFYRLCVPDDIGEGDIGCQLVRCIDTPSAKGGCDVEYHSLKCSTVSSPKCPLVILAIPFSDVE